MEIITWRILEYFSSNPFSSNLFNKLIQYVLPSGKFICELEDDVPKKIVLETIHAALKQPIQRFIELVHLSDTVVTVVMLTIPPTPRTLPYFEGPPPPSEFPPY